VPSETVVSELRLTDEQRAAVERRDCDLLLDAGAGSGKTSVLVERFARAVLDDGVEVGAILTITFTEKAAAELRDRIRSRLRSLGAVDAARATEGAFISTIHGFCARVLRANALAAGIDPSFAVLDRAAAERLMDLAFDDALEDVAGRFTGTGELLAAYGLGPVRGAVLGTFAELRSRGAAEPALPALARSTVGLSDAGVSLVEAAAAAAGSLDALPSQGAKVVQALGRLERIPELVAAGAPWPGDLDAVKLPGGNGAALTSDACLGYMEALKAFRSACEYEWAAAPVAVLAELLVAFGARYAELKRGASALDFEDLELMTRDLLAAGGELSERYAARFEQIMVDELQDTNAVQLELIESIADGNLFTVGDAQQSIYGFRHADVALFERRGELLSGAGARLTLQTNFRSRPEILQAINLAFASAIGERFRPLVPGREGLVPAVEPVVELLIADKGSDWEDEGIAAPWRVAEARALAARVASLVAGGAAPREVVVLTRATTDLRAYERALEERGIPTYVIGGRGYWSHPQILDFVAYLRALANPRDQGALYTVLCSPLVGVSLDALVIIAAAARASGRDPGWVIGELGEELDGLASEDASRLGGFAIWFATERAATARCGIEELLQRALTVSGYDLAMLAMPGGTRRLANVRKLMRLGREHDALAGPDLRGFLELVRGRAAGWAGAGDPRESEAPVEGEALDAVRLMTIHRAKGLEFEIVCVADLGRAPRRDAPLLRVGRDGRLGLRLGRPGTGRREYALDYGALREEQLTVEAAEERRLFYVAMTRARERLIVSGAVNLERWPSPAVATEPMAWVAPALVPDVAERDPGLVDRDGVQIALSFVRPGDIDDLTDAMREEDRRVPQEIEAPPAPPATVAPAPPAAPAPPVAGLSYSSLGEYARCGYRFYLERVLRLPPAAAEPPGPRAPTGPGAPGAPGLTGAERGIIAHALLERLDFRRPAVPNAEAVAASASASGTPAPSAEEAAELAALVERFAASGTCARLAAATGVRREERFAFLLGGVLVGGFLDVLAWESAPAHPDRALVVDYKSDRLEGADPGDLVARMYETQRLIYALAALRGGAASVEVAHLFLELPDEPVVAGFVAGDVASLAQRLQALAGGVLARDFTPAADPHRTLCDGCPGEGGLCSWPLSMTRREAPDRLF
jgi:ATP-dependent helicase/nuclease subunit A